MADNVIITPGSGNTVAADEVTDGTLGTVKVQYVKLMDGTLDGTTKAVINANGLKTDGSAVTQPISAVSLPLPTGASTETTLGTRLADSTFTGRINTQGQKTMAASTPVVLASDQTGFPVTQSGTWTVQPGNTANTTPWLIESRSSTIQTYSSSIIGLLSAAVATDIFTVTGSATKTVKIQQVMISSTATAAGNSLVVLLIRNTANSGGTSSTPAKVTNDRNNAAATATVLAYTANASSQGNLLGNIRVFRHAQEVVATGTVDRYVEDFGKNDQPIVLRGTSDVFAINLNGVTITGGSFNISVVWTEE